MKPIGKTGEDNLNLSASWGFEYHRCKTRHNELVDLLIEELE